MTVEEMQEIIGQFRNQGYNDMQISVAFGRLYLDDVCNYQDLRVLLGMLNMDIKKEFDEMSDEERKETLRKAFQIQ